MVHMVPNPDALPNSFVDSFLHAIDPDLADQSRCDSLYQYALRTPSYEPRPSSDAMVRFIDDLDSGKFDRICGLSTLTSYGARLDLQIKLASTYPAIIERLDARLLDSSIAYLESGRNDIESRDECSKTFAILRAIILSGTPAADKAIEVLKWHALNNPNFEVVRSAISALAETAPEKTMPILCGISNGDLYQKGSSGNEYIEMARRHVYNGRALMAAFAIGKLLQNDQDLSFTNTAKALYCMAETAISGEGSLSRKALQNIALFGYSVFGLDEYCQQLGELCP